MPSRQTALGVQQLEAREVPAIDLVGSVLTITDSGYADSVTVVQEGPNLVVTQRFSANPFSLTTLTRTTSVRRVTEIDARLGTGDDSFRNDTAFRSVVYGEIGNDELIGGSGDDLLNGGTEDDELHGRGGKDFLTGTWGRDRLYGGTEDDYLSGGLENDLLYGGDGSELMAGGEGDDEMYGQGGDDQLYGGIGDDFLSGGSGSDRLYGEIGNDLIVGGTGYDLLVGGEGLDVFWADLEGQDDGDNDDNGILDDLEDQLTG